MKVSILIPFFNSSPYLAATIESALNQTYADKEIILVDDGSTDDSLTIAKSFSSSDVKVFTQRNSGACRARNRAFEESSGDYIQYLDGDDLLSPDKIKNQMASVPHVSSDTVFSCRFIRFTADDPLTLTSDKMRFLDQDWDNPLDWLLSEWNGMGMGQTSIWLTPRHLINAAGRWNETLSINQDGEFFCRVLLRAGAIKFCQDSFVYYRSGNRESISQKFNRQKATDLLRSYKSYELNVLKYDDSLKIRRALASKYASYIYSQYDRFPDLVSEAQSHIRALGFERAPIMGGHNFKRLAKVFGFENTLKIRSFFRKVL